MDTRTRTRALRSVSQPGRPASGDDAPPSIVFILMRRTKKTLLPYVRTYIYMFIYKCPSCFTYIEARPGPARPGPRPGPSHCHHLQRVFGAFTVLVFHMHCSFVLLLLLRSRSHLLLKPSSNSRPLSGSDERFPAGRRRYVTARLAEREPGERRQSEDSVGKHLRRVTTINE